MSFFENISPEVAKYVLWQDPVKSGAVLGGATFIYVFVERMNYNVINILANLALVSVLVLSLWTHVSTFVPNRAPPATAPKLQVTEAQLRAFAETAISKFNSMCENLYSVGVSKDKVLILKVLACLYFAAQVGSCFHLLTLAYFALCIAFTWPLVYKKFQKEIDKAYSEASEQFKLQYRNIKTSVLDKMTQKGVNVTTGKKEE